MSKILVIGFNSRPIVESAVNAGYDVICFDYWGDLDLRELCLEVRSALKQEPGERLERIGVERETFIEGVRALLERHPDVEFALIGSGFDDDPEFWKEIGRMVNVLGNSPEAITRARDWRYLFLSFKRLGIPHPLTKVVSSEEEACEAAREIGFPVVLKPLRGSGGWGKRIAYEVGDVKRRFKEDEGGLIVQEYVQGLDASASFIVDGEEALLLSINEQLIGTSWLNAPGRFSYCGNVTPLEGWEKLYDEVSEYVNAITKGLGLKGSNGVDFIVKDGTPYFVEVNPRFQGSLECIEGAYNVNIVKLHVMSFIEGVKKVRINPIKFVGRFIVYASHSLKLPDLRALKYVRDVSTPGIILDEGDPVCSAIAIGSDRESVLREAKERIAELMILLDQARL